MKVGYLEAGIGSIQAAMYDGVHYFSGDNVCGKLCGKPVAVLAGCTDTVLSTVKYPLTAIEAVVISALNLLGCAYSKCRTDLKNSSLAILECVALSAVHTISALPKLISQVALGLWNHQGVDTVAGRRNGDTDNFVYRTRMVPPKLPTSSLPTRGLGEVASSNPADAKTDEV